jgi:hypothetical protein
MGNKHARKTILIYLFRPLIEIGFIIFLFYANLLMGEYTRMGKGWEKGILWSIEDIFTPYNFIIAILAAVTGHFLFSFFRKKM